MSEDYPTRLASLTLQKENFLSGSVLTKDFVQTW